MIGIIGFDSRKGLGIFLFTTAYRPALGPTQPPIQCVPGALFLGVKQPGREADHSTPSSAEVKECVELYLHSSVQIHGVVLSSKKHRDNFTFLPLPLLVGPTSIAFRSAANFTDRNPTCKTLIHAKRRGVKLQCVINSHENTYAKIGRKDTVFTSMCSQLYWKFKRNSIPLLVDNWNVKLWDFCPSPTLSNLKYRT
jgi:hypothetical protein